MPIKYHLDEHVDSAIADGLRRRGIDVATTAQSGLAGQEDLAHISVAALTIAVIFTNDRDFLRLSATGIQHCGIVYTRVGRRSVGEIIEHLALIHACMTEEEMRNHVEFF